MIDLELHFARYCFEVSMLARCMDAERSVAPYMERSNHFLRQLVAQMRIVSELPRAEAEKHLSEMLAFDPDLAVDQVVGHVALHRQCLKRLETACLEGEGAQAYDLCGPSSLELIAHSHRVLDYAHGILWAVKNFGLVD